MKSFGEQQYPLKNETFLLNGIAMEIHRELGHGFSEIVYKDALEYEFRLHEIFFEREREFIIKYKDTILPHRFYADFVVMNDIILEVKAQQGIAEAHQKQIINYLTVSKCKIGLIYNFGEPSLIVKRMIL